MERKWLDIFNIIALTLGIIAFSVLIKESYFMSHIMLLFSLFFCFIVAYEILLVWGVSQKRALVIVLPASLFVVGLLLMNLLSNNF